MENYFHLCSNVLTLFNINDKLKIAQKSPEECINFCCDEVDFFIECTAIETKAPYSPITLFVKIINGQVLCTNNTVRVYKLKPNHFKLCIALQKTLIYSQKRLLSTQSFDDLSLFIFDGTIQCIVLKNSENSSTLYLNEKVTEPRFFVFGKYYALLAKREKQDYLNIFNNFGETIFEIWEDEIEITKNQIITLQKLYDIAKHGYVCKYTNKNGKIELAEHYPAYLNKTPCYVKNKKVVGLAFLEALNIKNLKLARHYLSNELNNLLLDEQLEKYFGDYIEFEPNFLNNADNSIIFYYENNLCKLYKFVIEENKIIDITTD